MVQGLRGLIYLLLALCLAQSLVSCETPLLDLSSQAQAPPQTNNAPASGAAPVSQAEATDLSGCWNMGTLVDGQLISQAPLNLVRLTPTEYQNQAQEKVIFAAGKVIYPIRIPQSTLQGDLQLDVVFDPTGKMVWQNPIDASTGESAGNLSFQLTRCLEKLDLSGCWVGQATISGKTGEPFKVDFKKRDENTFFDEVLLELKFEGDNIATLPLDPTQDPPEIGRFEVIIPDENQFFLRNPQRESQPEEVVPMNLTFQRCNPASSTAPAPAN